MTAVRDIAQYLTSKRCNRLEPLRSTRRIQQMSGSALVNRGRATAYPLVMESINQPMAANHGRTLGWRNRNASHASRSIQGTATQCLLRCRAPYGAIRQIAG